MSPVPTPHIFPDTDACVAAAAQLFYDLSREAAEAHQTFRVALAGGSTPKKLYAYLAETPKFRDEIPWSKIHFFFGDERSVPPDHPESNFGSARAGLFSKVSVPAANIHRILAERPAAEAAALYQNTIAASFGGIPQYGMPPRFDLVFLGMGPDGHTASLFPGTAALQERDKWVVANVVPALHTERITMTYPLLNRAARIVLLVTGADKAERIASIFKAPPGAPARYPVQGIVPDQGKLDWYLDAAAGRLLQNPEPAVS